MEDVVTSIAARGELLVVAAPAVDLLPLGSELLVHQGLPAGRALEAYFVPVLLLVRQILHRNTIQCLVPNVNDAENFLNIELISSR